MTEFFNRWSVSVLGAVGPETQKFLRWVEEMVDGGVHLFLPIRGLSYFSSFLSSSRQKLCAVRILLHALLITKKERKKKHKH